VYLPGEQLSIDTSTAALSGVRLYALPGRVTAVRTGSGTAYGFEVVSDQHGTSTLWLDSTAQVPAWRQFDPYGVPRGAAAAGSPGSRGFLGDAADAGTGLTDVGARWYDPVAGMFASLDPVPEAGSPLELDGYDYAGDSPVDNSDPSGLMLPGGSECGIDSGDPCNPLPSPSPSPGSSGSGGGGGGQSSGSASCVRFGVGYPGTASSGDGSDALVAADEALEWYNEGADWLDQETGINSALACAEGPSAGGCGQAAGNVAMGVVAVGTDGLGELADPALTATEDTVATDGGEQYLYRGVHADHPALSDAEAGNAEPRGGHSDPALHNGGNNRSIFTSWTTDPGIGYDVAGEEEPEGVVLGKFRCLAGRRAQRRHGF